MQQYEDSTTRLRREREKEVRRQDILSAAAKIFAERGFAEATMEDVAAAAQVAKGTVYLYFETKNALLDAVLIEGSDRLLIIEQEAADSCSRCADKIAAMIHASLEFYDKYPEFFRIQLEEFLRSGRDSSTGRLILAKGIEHDALYNQVFTQGVQSGEFKDFPPALLTVALLGMVGRTVFYSQISALPTPLSQRVDALVEILLNGITRPCRAVE